MQRYDSTEPFVKSFSTTDLPNHCSSARCRKKDGNGVFHLAIRLTEARTTCIAEGCGFSLSSTLRHRQLAVKLYRRVDLLQYTHYPLVGFVLKHASNTLH